MPYTKGQVITLYIAGTAERVTVDRIEGNCYWLKFCDGFVTQVHAGVLPWMVIGEG